MKLSFKTILPIILISALLILLAGCYCDSPVPSADAGGTYSDEVCPGEDSTITFAGSGSGTGTLTYAWDFGDGGTSNLEDPSHTYINPFAGSPYTVTLTVTDYCGSATDEATVTITECNTVPKVSTIPLQAISAEGDVLCIPTYEFTVSNLASDDEGNNLSYSFVGNIPAGMTIDENSGKIVWVPVCGDIGLELKCHQCGSVCVTVRVEDDGCCQPLYTDVEICIEVFNGPVDGEGGTLVGIGFDGCPISDGLCN